MTSTCMCMMFGACPKKLQQETTINVCASIHLCMDSVESVWMELAKASVPSLSKLHAFLTWTIMENSLVPRPLPPPPPSPRCSLFVHTQNNPKRLSVRLLILQSVFLIGRMWPQHPFSFRNSVKYKKCVHLVIVPSTVAVALFPGLPRFLFFGFRSV